MSSYELKKILSKAKQKLILSVLLTIIVNVITIIKVESIPFILIEEIFLLSIVVDNYKTHKFLKMYERESIGNIPQIEFWNTKNCIFTTNEIIFLLKNKLKKYEYKRIEKMHKQIMYTRRGMPDRIHIEFIDGLKVTFNITNAKFVTDEKVEIESYLLTKNKNIIVDDTIADFGIFKV